MEQIERRNTKGGRGEEESHISKVDSRSQLVCKEEKSSFESYLNLDFAVAVGFWRIGTQFLLSRLLLFQNLILQKNWTDSRRTWGINGY